MEPCQQCGWERIVQRDCQIDYRQDKKCTLHCKVQEGGSNGETIWADTEVTRNELMEQIEHDGPTLELFGE